MDGEKLATFKGSVFLHFFPVRAMAQGSLCVRFPSAGGGLATARRISAAQTYGHAALASTKYKRFLMSVESGESSMPCGSICPHGICENCKWVKNGIGKLEIVEKNNGPRIPCFVEYKSTSEPKTGG